MTSVPPARHLLRAKDLADARYGALGLIGTDGRLSQFVTAGIDD